MQICNVVYVCFLFACVSLFLFCVYVFSQACVCVCVCAWYMLFRGSMVCVMKGEMFDSARLAAGTAGCCVFVGRCRCMCVGACVCALCVCVINAHGSDLPTPKSV